MSRQSGTSTRSASSKRDSGISDIVGAFPLSGNAHRSSLMMLRPDSQVLGSPADSDAPSPVYRLYPHQTANGRRLRAMDTRDHEYSSSGHHSFDTAIYTPDDAAHFAYNHHDSLLLNSASPSASTSVDDFAQNFSLPASRSQSRDRDRDRVVDSRPYTSTGYTQYDDRRRRGGSTTPTYKPKGFRIPTRTSSNATSSYPHSVRSHPSRDHHHSIVTNRNNFNMPASVVPNRSEPDSPDTEHYYGAGDRSSAESIFSQDTSATSLTNLPPLQTKGPDNSDAQQLEPLVEDDPRSFDLVGPAQDDVAVGVYALERRADLLFSHRHLQSIFNDPKLLLRFTSFLNLHRPKSIPLLIYYLDALKAIRAIKYANAISEALDPIRGLDFTSDTAHPTRNSMLEDKAKQSFDLLVQEDLPAYVSYVWIQVVSTSIQRRITGTLAPHLREASEGLAETFCLSDPSRKDNPIVFASEDFARTTQYGMTYAIGRNCRFLQGPRTSPHSVRRLAMACAAGKECNEVFINYRRDGSPFLNLLMTAPLMDSRGIVRYYIGAQVDVSGLAKGCSELPALEQLVEQENDPEGVAADGEAKSANHDEFQVLAEMFNAAELDTVRKYGGKMHKEYVDDSDTETLSDKRPRVLLKDPSHDILDDQLDAQRDSNVVPPALKDKINGKLEGVYQHYLLVRPAPSLRILFTSPSLRVPGILQSPFLHRIGGSSRVRNDLAAALADGRGVTAKVRWLIKADENGEGEGRSRWIHCTPLLGHSGAVGVWMIVLVEEEGYSSGPGGGRRFRAAPPVSSNIGGKDWNAETSRNRQSRILNTYDPESARRGSPAAPAERPTTSHAAAKDFATPYDRSGSQATNHVVHQIDRRPSATGSKAGATPTHSAASEFSFDLRG